MQTVCLIHRTESIVMNQTLTCINYSRAHLLYTRTRIHTYVRDGEGDLCTLVATLRVNYFTIFVKFYFFPSLTPPPPPPFRTFRRIYCRISPFNPVSTCSLTSLSCTFDGCQISYVAHNYHTLAGILWRYIRGPVARQLCNCT